VQPSDLFVLQLGPPLEGGEPRLPEDLVDPGAADAGDHALIAQQRMQVARLAHQLGELMQ
jgi:hypothetical protein